MPPRRSDSALRSAASRVPPSVSWTTTCAVAARRLLEGAELDGNPLYGDLAAPTWAAPQGGGVAVLVLSAHPDDEAMYAGGVLAALAKRGRKAAVPSEVPFQETAYAS